MPPRGKKLPEVGPYPVDPLSDENWPVEVRKMVRSASIVVSLVGRSPGIITELIMLSKEGALGKTRLLFPPVRGDELVTRWESFNRLVEQVPELAPLRTLDYRQLRAYSIGKAIWWHCARRRPRHARNGGNTERLGNLRRARARTPYLSSR